MMNRYEVELLINALTGGNQPNVGDSIVFSLDGWTFGTPSAGAAEWTSIDADGAVGDGVTNDTTALQSVLNRAKYVLIPDDKIYIITSKLVYYRDQIIIGLGTSSFKGALGTALMSSDNTAVACPNVIIAGVVFDNTSKATAGGIGLDGTLSELTLINVTAQNAETGFRLEGNARLSNTKTTDCTTHYDINGGKVQVTAPILVNAAGTPTGFNISGTSAVVIIEPSYTGITTEITDTSGQVIVLSDGKIWVSDGASGSPIIAFLGEATLGFYFHAATKLGLKGNFYLDGDFEQITGEAFGVLGATPITQKAAINLAADGSADVVAPTGIDNAQVGNVYAQVSELATLTTEYNDLRATVTDLRTKFESLRDVAKDFGFTS